MIDLDLPLAEERVRSLKIGDLVTFTGSFFTGRESFYIRAVEQGILPPIDFSSLNLMVHTGPIMRRRDRGWEAVSLTPTTSIRMDKYCPSLLARLGTRAIVGKGTMGRETARAMRVFGCVHAAPVGINAANLARQVRRVQRVCFLAEIGPTEATWVMEAEKFGPFLIDIDAAGRNFFHRVNRRVARNLREIFGDLAVPPEYRYTEI